MYSSVETESVSGGLAISELPLVSAAGRVDLSKVITLASRERDRPLLARQACLVMENATSEKGDALRDVSYGTIVFVDDDHPTVVVIGHTITTRLGIDFIGFGGTQAPEVELAYLKDSVNAKRLAASSLFVIDYAMPHNGLDLLGALRTIPPYRRAHAAILTHYPIGSIRRKNEFADTIERMRGLSVSAWAKDAFSAHPEITISAIHSWHNTGRDDCSLVLTMYECMNV